MWRSMHFLRASYEVSGFRNNEDEMLKEAVLRYIKEHVLDEKGLDMVLHCESYLVRRKLRQSYA